MTSPRETVFDITAASEVMAILCLSADMEDLKRRLGNIFIGYTFEKKPIYARDLKAEGAMAALLRDACKPNLVQTLEGNPVILHGGPFANIAQGTTSIIATRIGMSLGDYVVTETGFGFDHGGEKFLDIKCREAGFAPAAVVIVATIRALKYHGGASLLSLIKPDTAALQRGLVNLEKHLENVSKFGLGPVVTINRFATDSDEEVELIKEACKAKDIRAVEADGWGSGGAGTEALAYAVADIAENEESNFRPLYSFEMSVEEKIETIATKNLGLEHLSVCMAKTEKSLSDDPKSIGRPEGFNLSIREIEIAAGAGFLVPITGNIMRMPGLPAHPAAENITVDNEGNVTGCFKVSNL